MKKFKLFLLFVLMNSYLFVMADSPLTSTDFYSVYQSEIIVQKALQAKGMMTKDIMDYIVNESKPVAVKLATINALSFDMDRIGTGRDNFSLLLKYLKQKYGVVSNEDLYNKLDATALISLAYTRAMSDYFNVDEALNLALMAQLKAPNSLSIAVVLGLIESQIAMDGDNWCNVFVAFYARIYLNGLNSDFDLKGISVISEYIDLYREYCN